MANEIKTMAIPAMLQEAHETGLITEEATEALKAKKLQAREKIENLRRLHEEKKISREDMEKGIKTIQQEIQDKTAALDPDAEILA